MSRTAFSADDGFLRTVGTNISVCRAAEGMSQEELAERASISRVSLANIENGKQNVSILTLRSICSALEVDFDKVLPCPAYEEEQSPVKQMHQLINTKMKLLPKDIQQHIFDSVNQEITWFWNRKAV